MDAALRAANLKEGTASARGEAVSAINTAVSGLKEKYAISKAQTSEDLERDTLRAVTLAG